MIPLFLLQIEYFGEFLLLYIFFLLEVKNGLGYLLLSILDMTAIHFCRKKYKVSVFFLLFVLSGFDKIEQSNALFRKWAYNKSYVLSTLVPSLQGERKRQRDDTTFRESRFRFQLLEVVWGKDNLIVLFKRVKRAQLI